MTEERADASHWLAVLALDEVPVADASEAALGWRALMGGEAATLESKLEFKMVALFALASAARDPLLVIEVTALRALVLSSLGKAGEALVFARRASMMARTEADPGAELLANLVLARMRRHAGKPHLTMRILEGLGRLLPDAPRGWLEWERLLAGGTTPVADAAEAGEVNQVPTAARVGRRLLRATRAGARADFERAATELIDVTARWRDMQDEARTLVTLLDGDRAELESVRAFRRGDDEVLRYGLFGARVVAGEQEPGISIFAVARPGEDGRRILVDGLGLFGPCRTLLCEEGAGARRTHGRTDAGLATLVLAGPAPIAEADFFRRVYGFAYSPGTHRGVLDVLLHRMRRRIESSGAIARADGHLVLSLTEAIAVADPRCAPPAAARILSALARQPVATADEVAARLGITVRAAQMALQQLVSDGACVARRTGRHLEFQLQDSTFHEPTDPNALPGGG